MKDEMRGFPSIPLSPPTPLVIISLKSIMFRAEMSNSLVLTNAIQRLLL